MSTKVITIKMKVNKPIKVHFNPTLQNINEIQLIEYHKQFEGFFLFCDIIDSNFSLSNLIDIFSLPNIIDKNPNTFTTCKPSQLLAFFSDSKLYPKIPIQNKQ